MFLKDHPETLVHIENLFDTTIDCISQYYICNGCGHIYWWVYNSCKKLIFVNSFLYIYIGKVLIGKTYLVVSRMYLRRKMFMKS